MKLRFWQFAYIAFLVFALAACSSNDDVSKDQDDSSDPQTEQQDGSENQQSRDGGQGQDGTDEDQSDDESGHLKEGSGQSDQSQGQTGNDGDSEQDQGDQSSGNQGGDEHMPAFEVSFRPGIVPQQRLVEVKLDTDEPDNYYVAVGNKVLQYRADVDLYVGLIDSNNEDQIKKDVRVFQKN